MRSVLLDVNVLVALLHDRHVHHRAAHEWFDAHEQLSWASCPLTENGAFRILGNQTRVEDWVPVAQFGELFASLCQRTDHQFWPDDVSLADRRRFDLEAIRGHQQITDVYLLGLAVKNGGRFVTFDQGISFAAVKGARREHLEVIAPAL